MNTRRKCTQRCAVCLRIVIFILNGFLWIGGLFGMLCGLMIGFSNGTFSLDAEEDDDYVGGEIRWTDVLFTTPATLLVYYGVLILITSIFGCFAGAGGRRCCNITFAIAIILTILFDVIFGYMFLFNPFAMNNFIWYLDRSMDSYGVNDSTVFGIIPHHPTVYWNYIQRTGSCCGKFSSEEWRNKTIGSPKYDFSLPDSCCTHDYDYKMCGWRVWIHMEGDMDHYYSQMLKNVGCVSIFPEEVTTKYDEIAYMGIILGIFMIMCLIATIVLLVLTFSKKYKAGQGPQALPRFARVPRPSRLPTTSIDDSINDEDDSRYQDLDDNRPPLERQRPGNARTSLVRRDRHRVHPAQDRSEESARPRRLSQQRDRDEPKPILKPVAISRRRDSTQNIYTNRDFGGSSEVEELPRVYRGRAEPRVRENAFEPHRERGMSR